MRELFLGLILFVSLGSKAQFEFYQQSAPDGFTGAILDVSFVDENLGFAVGSAGQIIKTSNGGYTWSLEPSPTSEWINSVDFVDEEIGYIACNGGELYRTLDGGDTWADISPVSIVSTDDLQVVEFYDDSHGIIAGDFSMAYTIDGGNTWDAAFTPVGYNYFTDVEFATPDSAMAILADTAIYTTIDGGANWTLATPVLLDFDPQGLEVISSTHFVIVGGYGDVIYSKDLGMTWGTGSVPFSDGFYDVDFADENHGLLVGENRTILHTSDGGETWTDVGFFDSGTFYAVNYIDEGIASVVGNNELIFRSPAPNDLIIEDYLGPTDACPGDEILLEFTITNQGHSDISTADFIISNSSGGSGTFGWPGTLSPGTSASISLTTITVTATESYTVQIVGDDIIDNNTFIFSIDVYSTDGVSVSNTDFICPGGTAEIEAFGGIAYNWHNLDNDGDNTEAFQNVSPPETTTYYVTINTDHCSVDDSVVVVVGGTQGDCTTSANYTFTPNADGINDFFFFESLQDGENKLIVFNRWGNQIREFDNYDNDQNVWDGTGPNNVIVPNGTYYYTFQNRDSGYEESGWIQVLY